MTDTAVGFLLDNLTQLVKENAKLIADVKDDVDGLVKDLKTLEAFLKDAAEKSREHNAVRELMADIRQLTYDIEDVIDAYVLESASNKNKIWYKKLYHGATHAYVLRDVAVKAKKVTADMDKVRNNPVYGLALQSSNRGDQSKMEKKPPVVEQNNVVGFDDKATYLIDHLIDKTVEDLQVISVIGMPGLGKTTLANKVYNDPRVVEAFSTRGWIYVSKAYNKKDVLLSILKSGNQTATNSEDSISLVRQVREYLTWKYLIVLDDVWEKSDWDEITEAFPNCKKGSRILLTSRDSNIGVHANIQLNGVYAYPPKKLYQLDFLKDDESEELLKIKACGKKELPEELIPLSKTIASKCGGLPLALVVIGGLLQTKERRDQWQDVADSVDKLLATRDDKCKKMLDLSYDHLPLHLKACLLYFGVFPKENEIPVWILIRLWIAERFVQKDGSASLEKTAEDHLDELAKRNLVMVVKRSITGRIKTCRVHDVLRDLCLEKAKDESFLIEILKENEAGTVSLDKHRRLSIHSGVLKYIGLKPSGFRVRSFLCFAKEQVYLPKENAGNIPEEFKLLRVYHVRPIHIHRFPTEIHKLVHLTYVAFSGDFTTIPSAISKLLNLQTLIADTTLRDARTIIIQADILKLSHFRHLHTNKASQLICPVVAKKGNNSSNESVQTLTTIAPESCTEDVLGQTPCVKKLGIRGKLSVLEGKGWSFFNKLGKLETLKLFNEVFPEPPSDHKLPGLPPWTKFPSNLQRLTLADTFLEWKHMDVLGKLQNLEELKLKDNAFIGGTWILREERFENLKALQIWKTDLATWQAEASHFPKLQYVFLKECMNLVEIPSSLGSVGTLSTMKLHRTSSSAATLARTIKKWRQEKTKHPPLNVDIFPPDL